VKPTDEKGAANQAFIVSCPLHGLRSFPSNPGSELLGYYQSSANADWAKSPFMQSVAIHEMLISHVVYKPICLIFLLLFASVSQAQQPFVTDDADTTPKGKFHFEFSNEFDWLKSSSFPNARQNTADFELDFGLFDGVEIGIESPLITIYNANGIVPRRVSGIGDTNVSFKYNFHQESEHSRVPALAIGLNLELPTGDTKRQLGSGLADFYLNGIMQKSLSTKTKLN
jgi:hypothetical protein